MLGSSDQIRFVSIDDFETLLTAFANEPMVDNLEILFDLTGQMNSGFQSTVNCCLSG